MLGTFRQVCQDLSANACDHSHRDLQGDLKGCIHRLGQAKNIEQLNIPIADFCNC